MKKYSVRKLGQVSWIDTNSLRTARKEKKLADRIVGYGHKIINNVTNEIIE